MECLSNFIGISASCTPTASKSGLYIEDFPGFSIKSLSQIEGGKYLTVQAMLNRKLTVVGLQLSDMLSSLLEDVYIEQAADFLISKSFCEDYFYQEDGSPGLRIEKGMTALSLLYVPRIYFKSHIAVSNLVITVSDSSRSEIFTIDALADEEVTIEVNFLSSQRKIDITYSSTDDVSSLGVAPYTQSIGEYHVFDYADCDSCCGHRYLKIHGLDFNGSEKSVYYGIRADIELVCNKEKMVCLIAPQNKTLIFKLTIIEVLKEWIASDRFNFLAMNSKDWAKEQITILNNEIAELWFGNGPGIRNLLMNTEKKCFKCTGYEYKELIP